MQRYRHTTSYFKIPHVVNKTGLLFKKQEQPKEPDDKLILSELEAHVNQYEKQGYELINTQAVLKAVEMQVTEQSITRGTAYNLTDGIILFWKRAI
ncbi:MULTISPECIES: hypothetical protein [Entomomonas]|uniref:DUF4177 domain-containing protein n=1 Tax=Entomomonas asaccharolytica TaxID=2785331 RepID=A0A974NHV9_9GAMM|nr:MULTISPECIES: hypothetical protein [Entomomonas]QQP86843.1 hypothetical protein JHT90_06270 [Entomomonas asaccharolytica]UYZ83539.1 hypothetical protein MTZ49_13185 [Entomomonas sp. E2T0]